MKRRYWLVLLLSGWLAQGFPSCKFSHADDGAGPRPAISPADEDPLISVEANPAQSKLLFFHADWCGPCRQVTPTVEALIKAGWPIEIVDVDRQQATAKQYNVSSIPCFVLLKDGKEADRSVGAMSEKDMLRRYFPTAKKCATAEATSGPTPDWTRCPPVRTPQNSSVLADIDSHLPAGHIYWRDDDHPGKALDWISWGHETTHGINSRLRNERLGRG